MVELRRNVLISEISVIYRANNGLISVNIAIIGIDILTDILYQYLTRGPIADTSSIYIGDINCINRNNSLCDHT
ncbi:hypothetical protein Hanom_Chr01g00008041 [Helianthus anomalus]